MVRGGRGGSPIKSRVSSRGFCGLGLILIHLCTSRQPRRRYRRTGSIRNALALGNESLTVITAHLAVDWSQLTTACRLPRRFPDFTPLPNPRSIGIYSTHAVLDQLDLSARDNSWTALTGEKSEKKTSPLQIDPKWCVRHATLVGLLAVDRT